jgi:hypothetical protein
MKNLTFADISERKISEFVEDESSGSKIESYDGGDSWGGDFDDLDDVLCQVQNNPTLACSGLYRSLRDINDPGCQFWQGFCSIIKDKVNTKIYRFIFTCHAFPTFSTVRGSKKTLQ